MLLNLYSVARGQDEQWSKSSLELIKRMHEHMRGNLVSLGSEEGEIRDHTEELRKCHNSCIKALTRILQLLGYECAANYTDAFVTENLPTFLFRWTKSPRRLR